MTALPRRTVGLVNRVGAAVLMALIRTYQAVISPWVTQQCKYYPSCSAYGLEAVRVHGPLRGTRLTVWRILRCNPWSDGGVDHVPPARGTQDETELTDDTQLTDRTTAAPTRAAAPASTDLART